MTIMVKRVPGSNKQKPSFHIFKDGLLYHEEVIDGRRDVQPAFIRVTNRCKTEFQVELHAAGRDANKLLTWSSEGPAPKPAKEIAKPPKVTAELLAKGVKAGNQPAIVHRATPHDPTNGKK
jgi:hypothetical protein